MFLIFIGFLTLVLNIWQKAANSLIPAGKEHHRLPVPTVPPTCQPALSNTHKAPVDRRASNSSVSNCQRESLFTRNVSLKRPLSMDSDKPAAAPFGDKSNFSKLCNLELTFQALLDIADQSERTSFPYRKPVSDGSAGISKKHSGSDLTPHLVSCIALLVALLDGGVFCSSGKWFWSWRNTSHIRVQNSQAAICAIITKSQIHH